MYLQEKNEMLQFYISCLGTYIRRLLAKAKVIATKLVVVPIVAENEAVVSTSGWHVTGTCCYVTAGEA